MDSPKICISIVAENWEKAIQEIIKAEQMGANLFELRMDFMESLEGLAKIRDVTKLPLIATNRLREQGGHFDGEENQRINSLLEACETGFNYADLELVTKDLNNVLAKVKLKGARIILSHHDFQRTPPIKSLKKILSQELSYKPDICKIVGTSRTISDNLTYLNFLQLIRGQKLVSFGMGRMGRLSRIFSPLFGGEFTFASTKEGRESAPGQVTIEKLIEIYRLLDL